MFDAIYLQGDGKLGVLVCCERIPGDGVVVAGLFVTFPALEKLREALGVPGLTDDELALTLIERRLEAARVAGTLRGVNRFAPSQGGFDSWRYVLMLPNDARHLHRPGDTHLAAAQAAAVHLDALEAEAAQKRPEPEEMTFLERHMELHSTGYSLRLNGRVMEWVPTGRDNGIIQGENETPHAFHCRALREGRDLAGAHRPNADATPQQRPEPEEMTIEQCTRWLVEAGCEFTQSAVHWTPQWRHPSGCVTMDSDEDPDLLAFYRRAVRDVRQAREAAP